ncbi:VOC family protein [Chryseobacterium sp. JUb7]|uniref:VOC family protein n=1 Tax=Chryseobacterium sp. JUb7 TaxID=2940599 RepID=UPI0021694EB2|nr:VOC family protein [Chryseobacterium sp. JUb7]MCS3529326.1 catechol 2,3-dioxygenase-like lactoylglutathione lyase family enzyme [Chryseobacterium sp. JUb7]
MELTENITAFHHVSIKAQNFGKTVSFYQKLGFEVVHDWSLPDFNLEICAMLHHKAINYYLEICDKNADMPTQGRKRKDHDEYIENALLHICFTVKDAHQARIKAIELGAIDLSNGEFELDLINKDKSVRVKNSLVYSPNGEVIEFLEQVHFG